MKRRDFVATTALASTAGACGLVTLAPGRSEAAAAGKLTPPATGKIPVAFVVSKYATIIDFCGPWEVFQDVHVPNRGATMDEMMPFELYTVSQTTEPIEATGGMKLIPNYSFKNAPRPKVVVIPAQGGASDETYAWLRAQGETADVVMSVCTGAFVLGRAGMLAKRAATTHHDFFDQFAKTFPDVELRRGIRFVEGDRISTAGGLTSGIDLALRVVERYFGRDVAKHTAEYMEYQSTSWIV